MGVAGDKLGFTQQSQMLGNLNLGDPQDALQIPHAPRPRPQYLHNSKSSDIGQSSKGAR
jgi:hypothetical protein